MYTYKCPHCGAVQYTDFSPSLTCNYKKYRTAVCATANCNKTGEPYKVLTESEVCTVCEERMDCLIYPIVIATVVSKKDSNQRQKRWRSNPFKEIGFSTKDE